MMLQIKKLHPNAFIPTRENYSVGYDLYCMRDQMLPGLAVSRVKLGIATAFPPTHVAHIVDRSSMGLKGVHVFGGIIDPDYRGEWIILLYNSRNFSQKIEEGSRIAQAIIHRVAFLLIGETDELEETTRGADGFGSTGI